LRKAVEKNPIDVDPKMTIDVDGRSYDMFDLNHSYQQALDFCSARNTKMIPIDISDRVLKYQIIKKTLFALSKFFLRKND
jgi:hypothetical protein